MNVVPQHSYSVDLAISYRKVTKMSIWYRIKRAIYRLLGMKIEQEIVKRGSKSMQRSSAEGSGTPTGTPSGETGSSTAAPAGFVFDPESGVKRTVNQWVTVPRAGRQHILMEEDFQKLDKSDHDFLLDLDTRYENMNDETRNRVHEILKKLS